MIRLFLVGFILFNVALANADSKNSLNEDGSITFCYPKYKERPRLCQDIFVPHVLRDHIKASDIEKGFSSISDYGVRITDHIANPALKVVAKEAALLAAAAGYGPALALGKIALDRAGVGSQEDPIAVMAKMIISRIDLAEERIIGRLDEQFRQQAIDDFSAFKRLMDLYNTADTIEARSSFFYRARLAANDINLDRLIVNFENTRFKNKHVANYQTYIQLVALRLSVLAEIQRATLFDLYGDRYEQYHAEYQVRLSQEYKKVLSDVFNYINYSLAESSEWEKESNARFGDLNEHRGIAVYEGNHRALKKVMYNQDVRPLLFPIEQDFYDQSFPRKHRAGTVFVKRSASLKFGPKSYDFMGVPYKIHVTKSKYTTWYYATEFNKDFKPLSVKCVPKQGCNTKKAIVSAFEETLKSHQESAFHQFLDVYYKPTVEILDQWWQLYAEGATERPKNRLDLILNDME